MSGFSDPLNLAVLVCWRVAHEGAPILHVVHEADGDWQFLCGGLHGEGSKDLGLVLGLAEVLSLDPSLHELGEMCVNHSAERTRVVEAWRIHDGNEDKIRADVEQFGWHVVLIPEGNHSSAPSFAYTIGVHRSFALPDLLCLGLPLDRAHRIINAAVEEMRRAGAVQEGDRRPEVLKGALCEYLRVPQRSYRPYLGYAIWFYGGCEFPVFQLLYPDAEGRFPGEPSCDDAIAGRQRLLQD